MYSNLLGSSVNLHNKHLTLTNIYPVLDGALHVCYATCCLGDSVCCHNDVQMRHFAVGILSKSEVLDSTNLMLSQQFFTVTRFVVTNLNYKVIEQADSRRISCKYHDACHSYVVLLNSGL